MVNHTHELKGYESFVKNRAYIISGMTKIFDEFNILSTGISPELRSQIKKFYEVPDSSTEKGEISYNLYHLLEDFFKVRQYWININVGEKFFDYY